MGSVGVRFRTPHPTAAPGRSDSPTLMRRLRLYLQGTGAECITHRREFVSAAASCAEIKGIEIEQSPQ